MSGVALLEGSGDDGADFDDGSGFEDGAGFDDGSGFEDGGDSEAAALDGAGCGASGTRLAWRTESVELSDGSWALTESGEAARAAR